MHVFTLTASNWRRNTTRFRRNRIMSFLRVFKRERVVYHAAGSVLLRLLTGCYQSRSATPGNVGASIADHVSHTLSTTNKLTGLANRSTLITSLLCLVAVIEFRFATLSSVLLFVRICPEVSASTTTRHNKSIICLRVIAAQLSQGYWIFRSDRFQDCRPYFFHKIDRLSVSYHGQGETSYHS